MSFLNLRTVLFLFCIPVDLSSHLVMFSVAMGTYVHVCACVRACVCVCVCVRT